MVSRSITTSSTMATATSSSGSAILASCNMRALRLSFRSQRSNLRWWRTLILGLVLPAAVPSMAPAAATDAFGTGSAAQELFFEPGPERGQFVARGRQYAFLLDVQGVQLRLRRTQPT